MIQSAAFSDDELERSVFGRITPEDRVLAHEAYLSVVALAQLVGSPTRSERTGDDMAGTIHAMELRGRRNGPPIPELSESDQVVVLHGVAWEHYVALSNTRSGSRPLMAYLDGELEIVSTSREHEIDKKMIVRLLEAYAEVADISLNGIGNATFRKKAKQVGIEPDECYCVGPMRKYPTLAIEVVYTSGGIDKLEIYRRLEVNEVWFWIQRRFWIYRLVDGRYQERTHSAELPELDLDELARIVITMNPSEQMEAVRAYRRSLQRRR